MNKRHINNPERTKRGMHRYSSFFILSSSLLMFLLAACTNDPSEDILSNVPGNGDLPQGTFVIDYTASTGDTRTRLAASERIQSLDYLLYEKAAGSNDFLLKHRRTIPDIGENTVWPLTRETMTWAQREALKDTLNQSSDYKMVFVANANATIWDNTEVLQNVTEGSTFNDGRLVLPPRLFSDNDMYYLWSNHDAPLVGSNYNKNNPASMEITLQRMINKVEVKLDEEVVNGIASEGSVSNYVISFLDNYYDNYYFTEEQSGELYDVVNGYMEGKASFTPDGGSNQKESKENFQNILKSEENKKKVANSISECENSYTKGETHTCCVKHQFIDEMKEQFIKYCNWDAIQSIDITYTQTAYPYAIDFTMATKAEGTENSYTLNASRTDDGSHVFYTFGNNEANNNGLNQITSASFKDNTGQELFSTSVNIVPGSGVIQGNHHFLLSFNPTKAATATTTFSFTKNDYNLHQIIGWDWENDFEYALPTTLTGWHKDDMIKWVNSLFSGDDNDSEFIPYTLTLNIPQIGLENPWKSELVQ